MIKTAQKNHDIKHKWTLKKTAHLCFGIGSVKTDDNVCMAANIAGMHITKYRIFWYFPNSPRRIVISSNFIVRMVLC